MWSHKAPTLKRIRQLSPPRYTTFFFLA
jgi:hypothetical protein